MNRKKHLASDVRELATAAELSAGRAADDVVQQARQVVANVDQRLAFSGDATVVALAGATGSGKSSTFNAISQTTLARADVRRPTTSKAMAGIWAESIDEGYSELLSWLDVPERNLIPNPAKELHGLVLLDLPDHDSTESAHRMEVDRLVQLVDVFIWVVDPQKYADAALHDHYLRPLARHADVMIVALNQADRVGDDERQRILKDLRGLLDAEGLEQAQLVAISAKTGLGIEELRSRLAGVVKNKTAVANRLASDVISCAETLRGQTGAGEIPKVRRDTVEALSAQIATASGQDTVVAAVHDAAVRRGTLATGWPFVAWVQKLRPDPLKRLHLDKVALPGMGKELAPSKEQRSSLPTMGSVARAAVDSAVRSLEEEASAGLPRGWAEAVREAARRNSRTLPDDLDRAIARTDFRMSDGTGWQWIFRVLQWLLLVAVVVGGGWLLADLLLAYLQFPPLPAWRWHRLPLPTWLLLGGVAGGVVLSLLAKVFVHVGTGAKARQASKNVRHAIAEVTQQRVLAPVQEELGRYRQVREALDKIERPAR